MIVEEIKTQTNEALDSVSEQSKMVDESLTSLETVIKDLKDGDQQRDEEFKNVKEEIESLKELVPKVSEKPGRGIRCFVIILFFLNRCWIVTRMLKVRC
jgi:uncharacterized protein (UPF0305 family)